MFQVSPVDGVRLGARQVGANHRVGIRRGKQDHCCTNMTISTRWALGSARVEGRPPRAPCGGGCISKNV